VAADTSRHCATLLISKSLHTSAAGGRELLYRLNRKALCEYLSNELVVFEMVSQPRKMCGLTNTLLGNIDGVNEQSLKRLLEAIADYSIGRVFIDGSNFGLAARAIKSVYPSIEVIVFFHNCEVRFFLGALRWRPSVRACGVLLANYLAEYAAVRYSDKRICLSERDSRLLRRIYGREATHISPMAMQDQLPHGPVDSPVQPGELYALFVGGTFYANRHGMEWYVDNVAARAPIPVYVVGKGFERWKDRLERNGNVKVIGAVDSLAPWYLGAQFVIAPIFDGSGMKTKVAEALMFGKRVIGTPEAFVGYEEVARDIGAVCATANEFIVALNTEKSQSPPSIDRRLRSIYEEKYSYDAAKTRLAAILNA
jgi:polysaccharide biosynthesis protein PslH